MAPSSDGLLSSILNDDDLQLMDPAMGADGKNENTLITYLSAGVIRGAIGGTPPPLGSDFFSFYLIYHSPKNTYLISSNFRTLF